MKFIEVVRGCDYTQAYGSWFCLHVGSVAILFGSGVRGRGPRLELITPRRRFRWSKGYRFPGADRLGMTVLGKWGPPDE